MTDKACAFEQIEAQFDHNVVFAAEQLRDLPSYPPAGAQVNSANRNTGECDLLFHDLDIDLLHVHLLTKLCGKLGLPQQLRIDARRHYVDKMRPEDAHSL